MITRKAIIIFFIITILATPILSQNPNWTYYVAQTVITTSVDDGDYLWFGSNGGGLTKLNKSTGEMEYFMMQNSALTDNLITALAIDSKGNKWIGTSGGLLKYDNQKWVSFNPAESGVYSNNVKAIGIDVFDNIWVGTYRGMAVFNQNTNEWIAHYDWSNSILPDNSKYAGIEFDSKGHTWIGINEYDDLCLFEFDGNQWIPHESEEGPRTSTRSILIDSHDNKWVGTADKGLLKYNDQGWTVYNEENSGLLSNYINDIKFDNNGIMWIGSGMIRDGALQKFDGENWQFYQTCNSPLPDNHVSSITIDEQNTKWIGTWNGLAEYDDSNWTIYKPSSSGIPNNCIMDIAIDSQGNKWIGTNWELAKFDDQTWTIFDLRGWISSLEIDKQGDLWISIGELGLTGGILGLVHYNGTEFNKYDSQNTIIPSDFIADMAIDSQNNKWICSQHMYIGGIVKYDNENWTLYNEQNTGIPLGYCHSIAIDSQDNIWIALFDQGLAKYDGEDWTLYNENNSPLNIIDQNHWVEVVAVDNNDVIWIGTVRNVYSFNGTDWEIYELNPGGSTVVNSIYIDSQNRKWFCTSRGLAMYNDLNWTRYTRENSGLLGFSVNTVAEDADGNMWIGSHSSGLYVIPKNQLSIFPVTNNSEDLIHFNLYDNYPNPFNPTTTIKYVLPYDSQVNIRIFDLLGNEIKLLINEFQYSGQFTSTWDGTDNNGQPVSGGIYFYKLQAGDFTQSRKMVLLK